MNINKFKEGDIITRTEPNGTIIHGDRSYIGYKLEFVGIEKKIIFLISSEFTGEFNVVKLEEDMWGEGWDYFPETMWQKALFKAKKLAKIKD